MRRFATLATLFASTLFIPALASAQGAIAGLVTDTSGAAHGTGPRVADSSDADCVFTFKPAHPSLKGRAAVWRFIETLI